MSWRKVPSKKLREVMRREDPAILHCIMTDGGVVEVAVYGYNEEEKRENRETIKRLLECAIDPPPPAEPALPPPPPPGAAPGDEVGRLSSLPCPPQDPARGNVQALPVSETALAVVGDE